MIVLLLNGGPGLKMNAKKLYMNVLMTLLIGVPLCVIMPNLDIPTVLTFILLPIGIVITTIGIVSSVLLIQHKGLEN